MKKWMLALAAGVSLLAAACASNHSSTSADDVEVPANADHNVADVRFAQGMIPHHEQAVAMADLALATTSTPAVVDLATRIKAAQDPEILTMRGWLEMWGQSEMGMSGHGGVDGMMSDDDMSGLEAAGGAAFDRRFLEMMIEHHEGAIEMAEQVQHDGKFADARRLAEAIIAAQQAEIVEMQALLADI